MVFDIMRAPLASTRRVARFLVCFLFFESAICAFRRSRIVFFLDASTIISLLLFARRRCC